MQKITTTVLRQDLSTCIERLGDSDFAITKHGKVIAILTSPERFESASQTSSHTTTAPEPMRALESFVDPYEMPEGEYDVEAGEWSDGLDAEFEAYLSRQMGQAMDRIY